MVGHGPSFSRRWVPTIASGLRVVGFLVVVAGLYGPLTVTGPGSAIDIRATADLLLGGTVEAWAPRWVGVALYLPALAAAVGLATAGLTGRAAEWASMILALAGFALVLVLGLVVGRGLPLRAGEGYGRMLVGSALLLIGATVSCSRWSSD